MTFLRLLNDEVLISVSS